MLTYKEVLMSKPPPAPVRAPVKVSEPLDQKKEAKKQRKIKTTQNRNEQIKLEHCVILSGFKDKPKVDEAVEKFVGLFNFSMSDVKAYHICEQNHYRVVIEFNEKSTQLHVLQQTSAEEFSITLNQLVNGKVVNGSLKITCKRHLSDFNHSVSNRLYWLISVGLINTFKFTDYFFEFKLQSNSHWQKVTQQEVLDKIDLGRQRIRKR